MALLSGGIGATPVMAMLHALASQHSKRAVWWLHGARNRSEHVFALESRQLLSSLPYARSHIMYSRPDPGDRPGRDYDAVGRLSVPALDQLGVPREADFYLCGPASFLAGFSSSLKDWGVEHRRIHSEAFGPGEGFTPGIAAPKSPEPPRSEPALVLGFRSFAAVSLGPGMGSSKASSNSRRPAGFPSAGPAVQASATVANQHSLAAQSSMNPNLSIRLRKAIS